MRLLYQDERGGFRFTEDLTDNIPLYAILSHIWDPDGDEVTYDDLKHGIGRHEVGYTKIQFCGGKPKRTTSTTFGLTLVASIRLAQPSWLEPLTLCSAGIVMLQNVTSSCLTSQHESVTLREQFCHGKRPSVKADGSPTVGRFKSFWPQAKSNSTPFMEIIWETKGHLSERFTK
jgi:hypothetical protein